MELNISYRYTESFLPTKRHRKEQHIEKEGNCTVKIKEMSDDTFPVAFRVTTYSSIYEDAKSRYDFENMNSEYKTFTTEIRTDGERLFRPVRIRYGAGISTCFEPVSYISDFLSRIYSYSSTSSENKYYTENSIITASTKNDTENRIEKAATEFLIFDNKVWVLCEEPMYEYQTFGLGNGHGGTGLFIAWYYNENLSNSAYFNALDRDKAIEKAVECAKRRGDTEDINRITNSEKYIEVLMPEMVKRNPLKDHIA